MLIKIDEKSVYGTTQVAKIFKVTHATVVNWINKGALSTYKLPGGANRIYGSELIRLMKEMGMAEAAAAAGATRILIADDEPVVLAAMVDMLSDHDEFEVRTAKNGIQAGLVAKEFLPEIMVLDIRLGDMTGQELCQVFRSDPDLKDVKILGVSGVISEEEGNQLLNDGFDEYLPKPFRGAQLPDAIFSLLEKTAVK
ncbi:MAG: response regulator [Candidatus Lindowbacteria bacterium]|nr:response regulator [Candidatus Lindowbacteria bacterium]